MRDNHSCDKGCKVNENKLGRVIQIMPAVTGWRQAQVFREADEMGDCKNGKPYLVIDDVVAWALVESRDACGCTNSTVLPMVLDNDDCGDGLVVPEFIGGDSPSLADSRLIAPGEIVKLRDGVPYELIDVSKPDDGGVVP